jgi:hypothetical protein
MKLLIMQFSPLSCHFIPLRTKYLKIPSNNNNQSMVICIMVKYVHKELRVNDRVCVIPIKNSDIDIITLIARILV